MPAPARDRDLPNWYLGAGCITQTIWNAAHGLPAEFGIDDYDIVYFDADVSAEAEERAAACVRDALAGLPVRPDVKNQARVHVWYASRFGYSIRPYASCEDAIATWPTTATAIGVRCTGDTVTVEAPFGLHDLFELVVRPNRVQITPAIFAAKVERWITRWPSLKIEPWENGVGTPGMRWSVE
ncbi:MAG TPA: nucleotidyltransferase family protein [Longimicrobiales bacterium]|nr:nucleotidyltransferase family protein [Longimicrobiales bacterium]